MLMCVSCQCGSSDNLLRGALKKFGYNNFLSIPIYKGKDKAISAISTVPQHQGVQLLKNYIKDHSKYAVILGYDESTCRWADVASSRPKEMMDAELIVKHFG